MKVKVPDNWNEVTIGQFQDLSVLNRDSKDYSISTLSILIDTQPEDIRKFDPQSLSKILRHLEWAMKYPRDDYYKQEIEVDGKTYTMIENLNEFTGGQWWDMEEYLNNYNDNLHYLLAMIYRPLGEEYDSEKCKARGELFADKVMIGEVYGSLLFFSIVEKRSIITIQQYLSTTLLKKEKPKKRKNKGLKKKKE